MFGGAADLIRLPSFAGFADLSICGCRIAVDEAGEQEREGEERERGG